MSLKLYKLVPSFKNQAPKHICTVNYDNKEIEFICLLSKILNQPDIVSTLPEDLRSKEEIPVVAI